MKKIKLNHSSIILVFLTLCLYSCKKDFTNNTSYNINIGETFELYISENSCCHNCWINKERLKSIELVEKKLIESAGKDCDGSTSYYAWVFKGKNIGKDSIIIARLSGGDKCSDYRLDSSKIKPDIFIVTVLR
ncbi:MAG: hypothetical protein HGB12_07215 [Bacteroidetes bacterium]|nr:hypothetical protein [Bacteroidota bacterium]